MAEVVFFSVRSISKVINIDDTYWVFLVDDRSAEKRASHDVPIG